MLPHLRQIQAFAQFRLDLEALTREPGITSDKPTLARRLAEIWKPIPDYTTWIGTFGQLERRMQERMVEECAASMNVEVKAPAWLQAEDAQRLLQKIQNMQRIQREELLVKGKDLNEFAWTEKKMEERLALLAKQGWIDQLADGSYRLANWDHYVLK
jgi:hypothetical protein